MNAQRPIGYWLKLVDSLISEQFATSLEEHGVTRRQWQLLNLLGSKPHTSAELMSALAPFFDEVSPEGEPASPAEHLAELLESGWVSQDGDSYALTDRGNISLERLTELVEGMRERSSDGVTQEQYETTIATLQRMATNLGWSEADRA
ncbi:MAG: MarR family winged helix-turn-helix transcriptional regulator [Arthrobacter sp.]|uniref:MarR family winged helix-turn-helix transcriptional regulator n=1 Tax=Arthrobacter TaxID=1663 RepID=UPI00265535FB|nr:MarR family transcriptional regulator [Micrococcaceae bacterium]MDN5812145.1 MarR family transcriptional regulator [Micrococcaceae bacterium]MDN5823230.1 MarR family transcriptional regulator [Micrococcaceae bacterium]MDN5877965.1 MarR family transcriptional regulator [Micrococcaceae bacterium]MDN5885522.1 MarR family transcriptional regulator [Micrococcaceae bacterium]